MAEKTEAPSAARLRRAAAEGDVTVSPVVTRWAALAMGALLLPALLAALALSSIDLLKRGLTHPEAASALVSEALSDVAWIVLPWLAAVAGFVLVANLLQTRGALKRREPSKRNERPFFSLNALRIFDGAHWGTLLLALAGAASTAALGVYLALHYLQSLANVAERPTAAASLCFTVVKYTVAAALSVGLFAGAGDFLIRAWARSQRLRMTRAEWLEDQRAAFGDPAIRAERRRRQRISASA
ncbi:MAG TPA: EscU/YscU/HrcU family type III secretion system export apparatus switch protein [Polyangiaceae bacterium]|jgi:flagellar biosynthetic protein FlhB|nr:EscU/YscU/HrcU family type III secretion system export apparatus switch protein [Polyangiaceae bacterium]